MAVRYRSGERWQSDTGAESGGSQIQERRAVAVRYRSGERWQSDTISTIIPAHRERHKGRRTREMRAGRNGTKAWSSDETANEGRKTRDKGLVIRRDSK